MAKDHIVGGKRLHFLDGKGIRRKSKAGLMKKISAFLRSHLYQRKRMHNFLLSNCKGKKKWEGACRRTNCVCQQRRKKGAWGFRDSFETVNAVGLCTGVEIVGLW